MSETMTKEFVTSFLTTCFDAGLSKEAAAEMLQKESVDQVKWERPAFAEGYEKVASQVPGGMQPLLFAGDDLEKSAGPGFTAVMDGLRHLRGLFGATGRAGAAGAQAVGRGALNVAAPARVRPNSLVQKYPFPMMLGGATVAGAGALGVNHLINGHRDLGGDPDPFFAPGGYSPSGYNERFKGRLENEYGPGIAAHNEQYFGTYGRRKELEKALAEGKGGGSAYQELKQLNRKHSRTQGARDRHYEQLEGSSEYNRDMLERIRGRKDKLEDHRSSIWGFPRRAWEKMNGRNPRNYFDQEIGTLEDTRARSQMGVDLAERRSQMMTGGYSGPSNQAVPTPPDLQKKFFPPHSTD